MKELHVLKYSEMDVRNMMDAAIIRTLRKQRDGGLEHCSWNDLSDVICQEVMHDYGKER